MSTEELRFVTLTPHKIVLNSGEVYLPTGKVCRVKSSYEESGVENVSNVVEDKIRHLPIRREGVIFIVSRIVALLLFASSEERRSDVVYPATSALGVVRGKKGNIISVPFLAGFNPSASMSATAKKILYEEEI